MLPNHSASAHKLSRRSACDRCRAYKLRCRRDGEPGEPCERCGKAHLACKTTIDQNTTVRQRLPQPQQSLEPTVGVNRYSEDGRAADGINVCDTSDALVLSSESNLETSRGQASATSGRHYSSHTRLHSIGQQQDQPPLAQPSLDLSRTLGTHQRSTSPPPQLLTRTSGGPQRLQDQQSAAAQSYNMGERINGRLVSDDGGRAKANAGSTAMAQTPPSLEADDFTTTSAFFTQHNLDTLIADYIPGRSRDNVNGTYDDVDGDNFMFGFEYGSTIDSLANNNDGIDWSAAETARLTATTQHSHGQRGEEMHQVSVEISTMSVDGQPRSYSYHKQLLKLKLELMQNQEMMSHEAILPPQPGHNPLRCAASVQAQPVNRILNQTGRFWEILKAMSVPVASPKPHQHYTSSRNYSIDGSHSDTSNSISHNSSHGSIGRGWSRIGDSVNNNNMRVGDGRHIDTDSSVDSPRQTHTKPDHLAFTLVIVTYITLVRSCRELFLRLRYGLEEAAVSNDSTLNDVVLPKLQFGEFQIENNIFMQVSVLIELISSMLHRIDSLLNISPTNYAGTSSPPAELDYHFPLLKDPVAVSIREILLSQERTQTGEPSLAKILYNLKQFADRR